MHNKYMSDENVSPKLPTPSIPLMPPQRVPKKRRLLIVFCGLIFGFLPILIPLVASIFIDDALNEGSSTLGVLPWLTFYTLPIAGVIMLVGAIKPRIGKILLLIAGAFVVLSLVVSLPVVAAVLLGLGIVVYKKI